jgi:hypothetical protein
VIVLGVHISTGQAWLIGGAGAALALLAAHRLTISRDSNTRRIAAAAAFRAAILSELGAIYPTATYWPDDISSYLKSKFIALQAAVAQFRPFVRDESGFDAAWLRYYCAYPDKLQEQCYHRYMSAHDPVLETQAQANARAQRVFHQNVNALLAFANET